MRNTPARSKLGVFMRSALGVRDAGKEYVYAFGSSTINDAFECCFIFDNKGNLLDRVSFSKWDDPIRIHGVWGAHVDADGKLYLLADVAGILGASLFCMTPEGTTLWRADVMGSTWLPMMRVNPLNGDMYTIGYDEYWDEFRKTTEAGVTSPIVVYEPNEDGYYGTCSDFAFDPFGRLAVVGYIFAGFDVNEDSKYDAIRVFSANGNLEWSVPHTEGGIVPSVAAFDGDGNLFVAQTNGGPQDGDTLFKYGISGNNEWSIYAGKRIDWAIAADSSGVYVSRGSEGGIDFLKFNQSGELLWSKEGDNVSRFPTLDGRGNVYIAREAGGEEAPVKYSTGGDLKWVANNSFKYSPFRIAAEINCFLFGRNLVRI